MPPRILSHFHNVWRECIQYSPSSASDHPSTSSPVIVLDTIQHSFWWLAPYYWPTLNSQIHQKYFTKGEVLSIIWQTCLFRPTPTSLWASILTRRSSPEGALSLSRTCPLPGCAQTVPRQVGWNPGCHESLHGPGEEPELGPSRSACPISLHIDLISVLFWRAASQITRRILSWS